MENIFHKPVDSGSNRSTLTFIESVNVLSSHLNYIQGELILLIHCGHVCKQSSVAPISNLVYSKPLRP